MALPKVIDQLWDELQGVRAQVLTEIEGVSRTQADWRADEKSWSVGEIVDHLTSAEIGTGKLTTKLT